ncbi:MAG: hypothetical protein A2Z15_05880 [Chloroflexi bacterium RBG_16_50_11]|nr:MAG: hypothetical protein A2Z15_05880 [Chloroflexi bacterium RBG_16_50_11]
MKTILAALKRIPILTLVLVIACIALLVIALIIGIDSDRGVLVGWLATIILLFEITRRWRKEWHFLVLIAGAIIGSIILSALHDVVVDGNSIPQNWWLNAFHAVIKDIILIFTPMAVIYGIIGALTLFVIRLIMLCRKKVSEKT